MFRLILVFGVAAFTACDSAPHSPSAPPVLARSSGAESSALPCADEPWAWLPTDPALTRLSIDARAIRASRYAAAFQRHFADGDVADILSPPIDRMAVAHQESPDGAFVATRTTDPIPLDASALRVSERVTVLTEGAMIGRVPSLQCTAPEPALMFMVMDSVQFQDLNMLPMVGLPVMKRLTASLRETSDALVAEVRVSFQATLPSDDARVAAFVRGMHDELLSMTGLAATPTVEGSDMILRVVARTEIEIDRIVGGLAGVFAGETTTLGGPVAIAPTTLRWDTPTAPTIPTNRLAPTQGSNFGSLAVSAGFIPDPVTASGSSGGTVDASTWAAGCSGFVTTTPDHVLTASTPFPRLAILVHSPGDVTLIVERPDGSLLCSDDFEGTNPLVVGESLSAGQYRVWIGSRRANENHPYTLGVTELASVVPSGLAP